MGRWAGGRVLHAADGSRSDRASRRSGELASSRDPASRPALSKRKPPGGVVAGMKMLACLGAVTVLAGSALAASSTPLSFVWPTSVEVEPGGSVLVVENGLRRLVRV